MPGLNTTSTADISFMLLIFFLVTSSMDSDWGLPRQLPTPEDHTQEQEVVVKKRNALCLVLGADGLLTCNDESLKMDDLSKRVEEFVDNAKNDPLLPEKSKREVHLLGLCQVSDRHVIMIDVHPEATYDAYFQNSAMPLVWSILSVLVNRQSVRKEVPDEKRSVPPSSP